VSCGARATAAEARFIHYRNVAHIDQDRITALPQPVPPMQQSRCSNRRVEEDVRRTMSYLVESARNMITRQLSATLRPAQTSPAASPIAHAVHPRHRTYERGTMYWAKPESRNRLLSAVRSAYMRRTANLSP